jgi:hypothetical protein
MDKSYHLRIWICGLSAALIGAVLVALSGGFSPACSAADTVAAYCHPTLCITSSGCIPPCVCAKQQGEAYGTCTGTSHEP